MREQIGIFALYVLVLCGGVNSSSVAQSIGFDAVSVAHAGFNLPYQEMFAVNSTGSLSPIDNSTVCKQILLENGPVISADYNKMLVEPVHSGSFSLNSDFDNTDLGLGKRATWV